MRRSARDSDRIRLQHMRDATCQAQGFVRSRVRIELDDNPMLALVLVRLLGTIWWAADLGPQRAYGSPRLLVPAE